VRVLADRHVRDRVADGICQQQEGGRHGTYAVRCKVDAIILALGRRVG
jgi:hypothetical protein